MVKKRDRDPDIISDAQTKPAVGDDDSGSDEDMDMVDVEFEWFNLKSDIDFHGIKNLLRQLFDVDSQLIDLSGLTNLILSQPTIGSTVKVDGENEDPYAFLTVLNMQEHREKQVMKDLTSYLLEKAKSSASFSQLPALLSSTSAQVGLILSERLINVPAEIGPPMYGMLVDEIEAAVEDHEPYEFTHYLIVSKTYVEVESVLDQEDAPRQKKNKVAQNEKEMFHFHPEDEVMQRYAIESGCYDYTKDEGEGKADSKRTFQELGIKPRGHAILISAKRFEDAVKAVGSYMSS